MGFGEKLARAYKKIKTKLLVFFILFLVICVWGIAPLTRAIVSAKHGIIEYDGSTGAIVEMSQEDAEMQIESGERDRDDFQTILISTLLMGLGNPMKAFWKCFEQEPVNYLDTYVNAVGITAGIGMLCALMGLVKAIPTHEYEDIENGSSDWCEGGEQYKILNKKKGIVLAEKNYLPVDKRGNVNVLVVRRVWCW